MTERKYFEALATYDAVGEFTDSVCEAVEVLTETLWKYRDTKCIKSFIAIARKCLDATDELHNLLDSCEISANIDTARDTWYSRDYDEDVDTLLANYISEMLAEDDDEPLYD